jgi:hypothetical protein
MTKILSFFIKQCNVNQTKGYWLLFDAIYVSIFINNKFQINYSQGHIFFSFDNLWKFDAKLKTLLVNMIT